jgi:ABC-type transport system involved in cytochrome c biogenesis permease subunit
LRLGTPAHAGVTKIILLVLACFLLAAPPAKADDSRSSWNYTAFAQLPIQHEGRLKPLDSFARAFLTMFSGRSSIGNLSATAWLAELLFDPDAAYGRSVFNVASPAVRDAIGLPPRPEHRYSFVEIAKAIADHKQMIDTLLPKQGTHTLDQAQEQLLALYTDMLWYFEISRSVSVILPVFQIHDAASAKKIGVPPDTPFTYLEMMRHRPAYLTLVKPLLGGKKTGARGQELLALGLLLEHMEVDKQTRILRVFPPLWGTDRETWLSPWAVVQEGQGSPQATALLAQWEKTARAYRGVDAHEWQKESEALLHRTTATALISSNAVFQAEYLYNRAHFFIWSLAFYIAALLALLAVGAGGPVIFYRASFALLAAGALLHFTGLALRVFIMARPPVGTLYESVIFVGLIVVGGALIIEARTKQGIGLAIGALAGSVLQFIAMKYADDGDSMGMLVAVLNTNFWLATHVVAITIGYGCCIVAGLLAHLWLAQKIFMPDDRRRQELTAKSMLGASLVALLFAMTGTILGGIWADQSWGRFWGWDPKENGALLIVLWLLWLLHGRLSGLLKPLPFALGMALTTVIVALSWFGVNLLGVGLHSYGFTSGIAVNLALFVAAELAIVGTCGFLLRQREGKTA